MKELSIKSRDRQLISGKDFKGYFFAENIEEALVFLKNESDVKIIAGGTDILVDYVDRLYEIEGWLDLQYLDSLKEIKRIDDKLYIGSLLTHEELQSSEIINSKFPVLAQAAADIGSVQIRNRGTIGGNIANGSPAGDLLPPLLVYNASLKIRSSDNEKIIKIDDFFTGPKKTILQSDEIITDIIIPVPEGQTYGNWSKIGKRKALVISSLTLALNISFKADNKVIDWAELALGAVAPVPIKVRKASLYLAGRSLNEIDEKALIDLLDSTISPIDDIRATAEYRRDVAGKLVIRALEDIKMQVGEG